MKFLKRASIAAAAVTVFGISMALAEGHSGHVAKPLAEVEFTPFGNGPLEIAILWGDPRTGPSAVMLRFPPNFPGAMHHHTNGYHAILISGASKHWVEGETESDAPLQTAGDYWYQAGGQIHQDSFPTNEPTILFLKFDGPMDSFFAN